YRFTANVTLAGDQAPQTAPAAQVIPTQAIEQDESETAETDTDKAALDQSAPAPSFTQTPLPGITPPVPQPGAPFARSRSPVLKLGLALAAVAVLVLAGIYLLRARQPMTASARAGTRTLAVLPFQDLKQDESTQFLGFSLADSIITRLDYVGSLIVRPSSYIGKYRNKEVDPKQAASELNVDTLLTGAYIKDGDDLRITAQLVDVSANRILWQDTINVKYDKLLTVQDEVAQQIIKGLELNLSPDEAARLHHDVPSNPLAYEYYLHGVDLFDAGNFPMSVKMLEESTRNDPNYALAWAQLGASLTSRAAFGFGGRDDYARAQAAYQRALKLNPDQIEAHVYLANMFTDTNRLEESVPLLREAIKTNPNNAAAHWELSYSYRFAGLLPESIQEAETARRLDPKVKINSSAINAYLYSGEYEQFLKKLPAGDDASFVSFYRGYAEYYLKDYQRAETNFDHAYEREQTLFSQIGKALSYWIARQPDTGRDLLAQTEKKAEETGVGDPEALYKIAQAYLVLGDKSAGLRTLRHSVEGGFFCYPYMTTDPLLDSVRGDQDYASIMEAARTRFEQFRKTFMGKA
ncbi:MAG TPA: tetratricopeptide repeat protein, partial [Blastocatellia bacterium]|nr:tetratricopeptide repeat protein [Blastocatellia bacterium]